MTWAFTNANDYVHAGNWAYTATELWLNGGDDYVSMPANAQYCVVHSGEGADFIIGSSNSDAIYGDNGSDVLYGMTGNDWLIGGGQNDQLLGGEGRDSLMGGHGGDRLTGGADGDWFHFQANDSINAPGWNDTITDWDVRYDYIVMHGAPGTSANYGEYQTNSSDPVAIGNEIFNSSWRTTKDNVFAYNSRTDTGYLFSDTNGDNYFDNAVIISGAGSASDMNYSDIL